MKEDIQICASCDSDIVLRGDHWEAIDSRFPSSRHCYYSAVNGQSVEHQPEQDPYYRVDKYDDED